MTPAASSASIETFRDPAGILRIQGDRVLRTVRAEYVPATLQFLDSALAQRWVADGRMIPTRVLETQPDGSLYLEHDRVFFPTYPWEWLPDEWIAAALLTLDLSLELLSEGLILKDATPLNILFDGPRPVLVDVLSMEARDAESPLWLAYGQFVRTFLLPLLAHKYLGWPLAASLEKRDGYEPGDLYPYVPVFCRWRNPFRSLVTIPAMLEKRAQGRAQGAQARIRQRPEIAAAVLGRQFRKLRKLVLSLRPSEKATRWSSYPTAAEHYSGDDHTQKQAFVRRALAAIQPRHVLDLGANTGVYSRIAVSCGASVVAWDTDIGAATANFRQAQEERLPILPMVADPSRPTPATGWRNSESLSLLDRAYGRFDCVMMLGLIHHLLLADQIPLPAIAGLVRDLTCRHAIVEWVPATDPRFVDLCRGREALYGHLDEAAFLAAFEPLFSVSESEALANGRKLFLLQVR
jgi:hypothetical protein